MTSQFRIKRDYGDHILRQFARLEEAPAFPPRAFHTLLGFDPAGLVSLSSSSLDAPGEYRKGFAELESKTLMSNVARDRCWSVLCNAFLFEDWGFREYSSARPDDKNGDLFRRAAASGTEFVAWHGALVASYQLNLSLVTMLLLWKGDMYANARGQLGDFYFSPEKLTLVQRFIEASKSRAMATFPFETIKLLSALQTGSFIELLQGGASVDFEPFSDEQLRALDPFLDEFAQMPQVSDTFRLIATRLRDRAVTRREAWAAIPLEEPVEGQGQDDAFGDSVQASSGGGGVAVAGAPAAAGVAMAGMQIQDNFLRNLLPSPRLAQAIQAVEKMGYAQALEWLQEETRSGSNTPRNQFISYLLLARIWMAQGEQNLLEPVFKLLWREARRYGVNSVPQGLHDYPELFRWEPALLGELSRLTLQHMESQVTEDNKHQINSDTRELTGYELIELKQFALAAGVTFITS